MNAALDQAVDAGRLLPPSADVPNFVDRVRALAMRVGIESCAGEHNGLTETIPEADDYVFVIVDGLGLNLLPLLDENAFLRRSVTADLRAIFPSTTTCAMTTLATGMWPAQHGMTGWWVYLPDRSVATLPLRFVERRTQMPLPMFKITGDDLWPHPSLWADAAGRICFIQPESFWDSSFSRYLRGDRPGQGYRILTGAVDKTVAHCRDIDGPTFTYLYLPQLDDACHAAGIDSNEALNILIEINAELERLADELAKLPGNVRLVISADHGHINIADADAHTLRDGDPLLGLLDIPSTGEPRTPLFHVREGAAAQFVQQFNDRFSDQFALLSINEADRMHLFGPDPLTDLARARFGDFVAIALEDAILMYAAPRSNGATALIGRHAGMTPREMQVPLIVI